MRYKGAQETLQGGVSDIFIFFITVMVFTGDIKHFQSYTLSMIYYKWIINHCSCRNVNKMNHLEIKILLLKNSWVKKENVRC